MDRGGSGRRGFTRQVAVAAVTAALGGAAHALPLVQVAPVNYDFGAAPVGVQRDLDITVTNVSGANVTIVSTSFGSAPGGATASWSFSLFGPSQCDLNTVLVPGGSCRVVFSVIQTQPGVSTNAVNMTVNIVDATSETFALTAVARTGSTVASIPALAPAALALLGGLLAGFAGLRLRRRRAG